MKRLITWMLLCAMMMCNMSVTALAQTSDGQARQGQGETAEVPYVTGDFSLVIRFAYPEREETLAEKAIEISLLDEAGEALQTVRCAELLAPQAASADIGGRAVTVSTRFLNEYGEIVEGAENGISFFQIDYQGLSLHTPYRIKLTGNGYADYLSEPVILTDYSRKLVVNTASGDFTLGDLNHDKAVDGSDLEAMTEMLDGEAGEADLNGDGRVDIADIAFLHRQIYSEGRAALFETSLIAAGVAKVDESQVTADGDTADLFRADSPAVTFHNKEAGKSELTIPITFAGTASGSVEMEQIEILSPQTDGAPEEGYVTVSYEDEEGNLLEDSVPFAITPPEGTHAIYRTEGRSRVVISLGRLVAVKSVKITVTKVAGSQGADFAVVEEIQFLKDIVPDNPNTDSAVPKGVTAAAGDGQVELSWKPSMNVEGYLVRYGDASGVYTLEAATETNQITIKGLKNLQDYYFVVYAVSGEWRSAPSAELIARPEPKSAPLPPDMVKLEAGDQSLKVSWGKAKNATGYHVYYKESAGEEYQRANSEPQAELSYMLSGLTNGVEYSVYVTAVNDRGESKPSLISKATPQEQKLEPPAIPSLRRIDNSEIASVTMQNPNNVAKDEYPDGFSVNNVIDGDYNTHWTARAWWESSAFTFEFQEGVSHTMDYLVYVPRLDGNYRKSLSQYKITAWDEEGGQVLDMSSSGPSLDAQSRTKGYAVLTFPKTEDIHKITVQVTQWSGSPTNISLSEIAFYDYYSLDDQIKALFADDSFTELARGVTREQIRDLEAQVNDTEGYFVDSEIFKDEIALAGKLLEGDKSALGKVVDTIESRNTKDNIKVVNTFQPLGIVANAGKEIVIYAQIPEGEKVQVVPTQYFAEAASWAGGGISLKSGRNVITIPKLTSIDTEKGGALYLQYSGDRPEEIKLQVRGADAVSIPVLELSEFDSMTETEAKAVIGQYIQELTTYYETKLLNKMGGKKQSYIRNSTEISMPHVLLSVPAEPVYNAVKRAGTTMEEKVELLYRNTLAWKDLIHVLYRTHGIDDVQAERSRQNIRYARMFGGAFMYASGAHIGIGYGSAGALVQGQPVSVTGAGQGNKLFGWGIAHEIGHVLDTLGKAETTNNIYSLFGQTYDGADNAGTSRLESGNKYEAVFQNTAVGAPGTANDVFVSLGMYWQLHLAYDGADDNFYNLLNKAYRSGKGAGFSGDDKLAVVASEIAGYDLTEFFRRWGITLSREAKEAMASYQKESRSIWYLDDNSRRAALNGEAVNVTGALQVEAKPSDRDVALQIRGLAPAGQIQGYEIRRNGTVIAFTKNTDYVDHIGSANNIQITYEVTAYDILGRPIAKAAAQPFVLSVENFIGREYWNGEELSDGSILITFSGDNMPSVSGFFVKGQSGEEPGVNLLGRLFGKETVSGNQNDTTVSGNEGGGNADGGSPDGGNLSSGTVSGNQPEGHTRIQVSVDGSAYETVWDGSIPVLTKDMAYLFYRGADDGSIGIYDPVTIRIENLPEELTLEDIDFIAYPGDSISLDEMAVGYLSHDLQYGEEADQMIPQGSMIVTGSYRGDPVYNTIQIMGRFQQFEEDSLEVTTVERPINGQILLFAPVTEGQDMAEINNGVWIFIPDVQKEQELQGDGCKLSILPAEIMAQLYRTDDPYQPDSKRLVSNTLWYLTPEEASMPDIEIQ